MVYCKTKPQFGHMKAKLNQDCQLIQREAMKGFKKVCMDVTGYTEVKLAKASTIKYNKLNNTSHKIMEEMKKVQNTQDKLRDLHDHCAKMLDPMSRWTTQFFTSVELECRMELSNAKLTSLVESKADHIQQLLHPLRNAIETLQRGVEPMEEELKTMWMMVSQRQGISKQSISQQVLQEIQSLKNECIINKHRIEHQQKEIQQLQHAQDDLKTKLESAQSEVRLETIEKDL